MISETPMSAAHKKKSVGGIPVAGTGVEVTCVSETPIRAVASDFVQRNNATRCLAVSSRKGSTLLFNFNTERFSVQTPCPAQIALSRMLGNGVTYRWDHRVQCFSIPTDVCTKRGLD